MYHAEKHRTVRETEERSEDELLADFFFRNHGSIFAFAAALGSIVVVGANILTSVTLYQNLMLSIGWTQAVITGYLSFKIFEVGKRDSELPNLSYRIADVEDVGSPYDNHMVVRCTVQFINTSYGRAQITDIDLSTDFDEMYLQRQKKPGEGTITHGFPEGKPVPKILDKGEVLEVMFQVNGYNYLDSVSLDITEETLGTIECQLFLSEISNRLAMKRRTRDEGEREESQ